jgi:hypothetical protein
VNTDHLRAFVLAVDEGTFESAAALLLISGSAFSQRIKALEKEVGQVLLGMMWRYTFTQKTSSTPMSCCETARWLQP